MDTKAGVLAKAAGLGEKFVAPESFSLPRRRVRHTPAPADGIKS